MPKQVAIIGGGMAGLSAALTLAKKGINVTVFEASQTLGGRVRSLTYNDTILDNGQHILLGAYKETLAMMEDANISIEQVFKRLPLNLSIRNFGHQVDFSLSANCYLPAPFHIAWGLLFANGINLKTKLTTLRFLSWLNRNHFALTQDEPLSQLLSRHNQDIAIITYLWEPLCLAALNTPIHLASAQIFLNVLKDSFAQRKQDADLLLPTKDLSQLLAMPIANKINVLNGNVVTGASINTIKPIKEGYAVLHQEQTQPFSHLILACGPHQIKNLSAFFPQLQASIQSFTYQPITTVYLQYEPTAQLPKPMIGVVNSQIQWVFDRGQLLGQSGLMAVVISAHKLSLTQSQLVKTVESELSNLYPHFGNARWVKAITEKKATFSCEHTLIRPTNKTHYKNIYLAGDYTKGDYPATIEGAVRSGIEAARLVNESQ
jgi:hydroxysqualene dehydroxylase